MAAWAKLLVAVWWLRVLVPLAFQTCDHGKATHSTLQKATCKSVMSRRTPNPYSKKKTNDKKKHQKNIEKNTKDLSVLKSSSLPGPSHPPPLLASWRLENCPSKSWPARRSWKPVMKTVRGRGRDVFVFMFYFSVGRKVSRAVGS